MVFLLLFPWRGPGRLHPIRTRTTPANSSQPINYVARFEYLQQLAKQSPPLLPTLHDHVLPLVRANASAVRIERAILAWSRGHWSGGQPWPFISSERDTWIFAHVVATLRFWALYSDSPPPFAWGPMHFQQPVPFQPALPPAIYQPLLGGPQIWDAFAARAKVAFYQQLRDYRKHQETVYGLRGTKFERDALMTAQFQCGAPHDHIAAFWQRRGESIGKAAVIKAVRGFADGTKLTLRTDIGRRIRLKGH